ncbi:unnamed protein product [marine sediment metagenome]|uniref:Uncharacterized protein n=1 Tax=marine sediment metagenome TaxID=412755 RepID=X0YR55_9ZZZZ
MSCGHSNWLYFFGKGTLKLVKWCLDCDEEIRKLGNKTEEA